MSIHIIYLCWKMDLSDFQVEISTMDEMNLDDSVLCGILVLKRYPSENAQNELAVATVEAVLLGSFMLAPLLQFPSTLLEALVINMSTETADPPAVSNLL